MEPRETLVAVLLQYVPDLNPEDDADRRVMLILQDLTNRRGWRQEWDGFDDDIKVEIIEEWRRLMRWAVAP